jgi:hypothetical protein
MAQGASRARKLTSCLFFFFGWAPPTGFLVGGATLCHIDKMFLNLGPTNSHTGTRLMVHKLHDLGSFIKFYGQRTEGLLQDESIIRVPDME